MSIIDKSIHNYVYNKLVNLYNTKCIPRILIYGRYESGKTTIVNRFLHTIYKTDNVKSNYILSVNCAKGTDISFVRNKIKLFSDSNDVEFIDLTQKIQEKAKTNILHGPTDWIHFNSIGYEFIADNL